MSISMPHQPSIRFRKSKHIGDLVVPMQTVFWDSTITGVDEGDGWLKVSDGQVVKFLPMVLLGSSGACDIIRPFDKYKNVSTELWPADRRVLDP